MKWIARQDLAVSTTGLLPAGAAIEDFTGAWISRGEFSRLAAQPVATIDGTIYTDGAFTGFKPSRDRGASEQQEYKTFGDHDGDGLTFNGAVIARDVDVLAPGGWYVRYDNRNFVGEGSAIDFEPSRVVEFTGWREE
jgi:hypothetical protein